nr:MAG TPA: hypothetical protein [Caudoviricetes sp.]
MSGRSLKIPEFFLIARIKYLSIIFYLLKFPFRILNEEFNCTYFIQFITFLFPVLPY